MNSMKRQKDKTRKDELRRAVGAQYATEEEWRNDYISGAQLWMWLEMQVKPKAVKSNIA